MRPMKHSASLLNNSGGTILSKITVELNPDSNKGSFVAAGRERHSLDIGTKYRIAFEDGRSTTIDLVTIQPLSVGDVTFIAFLTEIE